MGVVRIDFGSVELKERKAFKALADGSKVRAITRGFKFGHAGTGTPFIEVKYEIDDDEARDIAARRPASVNSGSSPAASSSFESSVAHTPAPARTSVTTATAVPATASTAIGRWKTIPGRSSSSMPATPNVCLVSLPWSVGAILVGWLPNARSRPSRP